MTNIVICTFCQPKASEPVDMPRLFLVSHLFSSRGGELDDMQRQIMVIRTTFRHPVMIESDGTQRQIMVILHLLTSTGGEPDDMRRQIMVIRTPFTI